MFCLAILSTSIFTSSLSVSVMTAFAFSIPAFFKTDDNGPIPYDIFAASFFLLSRYEELIPKIKTTNEFFDSTQSLAFKEGFLEMG